MEEDVACHVANQETGGETVQAERVERGAMAAVWKPGAGFAFRVLRGGNCSQSRWKGNATSLPSARHR